MNEEIKSSFLIIKESLRLTLRNFYFIVILVVLGWIFVKLIDTFPLFLKFFSTIQIFLYMIISLYITAGTYACVCRKMKNGNSGFKFFINSANRFFFPLLIAGIGIVLLQFLISFPLTLFHDWIIKTAQNSYLLILSRKALPSFLGLCLTIYVFPFLFTQNMLGMKAVSQGVRFVFRHLKRSLPLFIVLLTQFVICSMPLLITVSSKNLNLYPLFKFFNVFIPAYVSILVFIAAGIILENDYRRRDV